MIAFVVRQKVSARVTQIARYKTPDHVTLKNPADPTEREARHKLTAYVDTYLVPRIKRYTQPVFWPADNGEPELVGTCLVLRLGCDAYLVTAGHVLDLKKKRELAIVVGDELKPIAGQVTRCSAADAPDMDSDHIDVGVVRLRDISLPGGELALRDVELSPRCLPTGDAFVVMGYPSSRNRKSYAGGNFHAQLYHFVAPELDAAEYDLLHRNPSYQVALSFDRKSMWRLNERVTAPDLYGMSGGGVWRLNPRSGRPLHEATLDSIAVEWHATAKIKHVLTTRLQPTLAILSQHYPDVREAIRVHVDGMT